MIRTSQTNFLGSPHLSGYIRGWWALCPGICRAAVDNGVRFFAFFFVVIIGQAFPEDDVIIGSCNPSSPKISIDLM